MAVLTIARFEVRPEAHAEAERAMHEFASHVRTQLPGSSWTVYRDPRAPTHYTAMLRVDDVAAAARHRAATGPLAFEAALGPLLVGAVEVVECELVTSSDLQRRHRGR